MKKNKFFLLIIVLAMIDQITKVFIILLKSKLPVTVINNVLEIVYYENRGIAFGIRAGTTQLISLFTAVLLASICVAIYKNYEKMNSKIIYGSILLLAGGLGNLLDRIFRLYVVDFIYVKAIDFPVFNFADICVVLGVITIIVGFILMDRREKVEQNNSGK